MTIEYTTRDEWAFTDTEATRKKLIPKIADLNSRHFLLIIQTDTDSVFSEFFLPALVYYYDVVTGGLYV